MRFHLPPSSFTGYLRRCESCVMPCSRTAAPLAQCAPRLIGESNTGSWRTHTPFTTTASIAQPTEQFVHPVRLTSVLPAALSCASALPIMLNGNCEAAAPAPSVTPERLRKVRRSLVLARTPRVERCSFLSGICDVGEFFATMAAAVAAPPAPTVNRKLRRDRRVLRSLMAASLFDCPNRAKAGRFLVIYIA